jgi:molybdate transport system substrate-binding protein
VRWAALLPPLLALALAGVGCGSGGADEPQLTVSAATSLRTAFSDYGRDFTAAKTRFAFAGSDELAAQIEQGLKPDVYAAANTELPGRLYAKGLVEKPKAFAGNQMVLAVPAGSARVASLRDLAKPGVTLAIGQAGVPVGSYTHTVLDRLPAGRRTAILANVRSEEPDVAGITGKLTQGAVDAGFLYATDVRAAGGRLDAIELPAALRPAVAYGVAVVKGAKQPEAARAFIDGLTGGAGAKALADAGFDPPPKL